MLHQPLISVQELQHIFIESDTKPLILDARYNLSDPAQGLHLYQQEHIPTAHFIDLGKNLCGTKTGINGRHPLPSQESFIQHLRSLGMNQDTHVIVYDQQDSMFAAHLWWMLLWVGHSNVQVLDGGLHAWKQNGGEVTSIIPPQPQEGNFTAHLTLAPTVDATYVLGHLQSPDMLLIDARAPERYRGDIEPLDPVAGHIPGAINHPFASNLTPSGRYKPKEELRKEWQQHIKNTPVETIVHQCGSGVSACHNILAMVHAGFGMTALYPGSWSEWCANAKHPTAKG